MFLLSFVRGPGCINCRRRIIFLLWNGRFSGSVICSLLSSSSASVSLSIHALRGPISFIISGTLGGTIIMCFEVKLIHCVNRYESKFVIHIVMSTLALLAGSFVLSVVCLCCCCCSWIEGIHDSSSSSSSSAGSVWKARKESPFQMQSDPFRPDQKLSTRMAQRGSRH